jgi:hypothetical protein
MEGGSEESGNSYNGPGGSGYSKKKKFNQKLTNTNELTNIKGMSTGWNANSNSGNTAGSSWSMNGGQSAQTWGKTFVEEPEYLYGGVSQGGSSNYNAGGSQNSNTGQYSNASGGTNTQISNINRATTS